MRLPSIAGYGRTSASKTSPASIKTDFETGARSAYTLLEVLLSIGLISILVAGLSSGLHAYVRFHQQTSQALEQSVVLRGILDDLHRDVRGIRGLIETAPSDLLGDSFVPSTFGQESFLVWEGDDEGELIPFSGTPHAIFFSTSSFNTFLDEATTNQDSDRLMGGVAWVSPSAAQARIAVSMRNGAVSEQVFVTDAKNNALQRYRVSPAMHSLTHAYADVTQLEFRFWDGDNWLTHWNSMEKQSLPKAIEIVLRVRHNNQQSFRAVIALSSQKAGSSEVAQP